MCDIVLCVSTKVLTNKILGDVVMEYEIYENKGGIILSRPANALEYVALKMLNTEPNEITEHFDEINMIYILARRGDFRGAEEIIQKIIDGS